MWQGPLKTPQHNASAGEKRNIQSIVVRSQYGYETYETWERTKELKQFETARKDAAPYAQEEVTTVLSEHCPPEIANYHGIVNYCYSQTGRRVSGVLPRVAIGHVYRTNVKMS